MVNRTQSAPWRPFDSSAITSRIDYTIEASSFLLQTLRDISSMTPVPFLSEAAAITVRLLSIAQDVRNHDQAFKDLASDAYGLVYTISVECRDIIKKERKLPERLERHIITLTQNLREVEKFAGSKILRGKIKKIIYHTKDLEQITRYRTLLRQSLDVFGLQTSISIQQDLNVILDAIRIQSVEHKQVGSDEQDQDLAIALAQIGLYEAKLQREKLKAQERELDQEIEKWRHLQEKRPRKAHTKENQKSRRTDGSHQSYHPATRFDEMAQPLQQPYQQFLTFPSPYMYSQANISVNSVAGSSISIGGSPIHMNYWNGSANCCA